MESTIIHIGLVNVLDLKTRDIHLLEHIYFEQNEGTYVICLAL